jgi:hypothetical protein
MTREGSSWAVGYTVFAAVVLMMIGAFHFMAGLVGIVDDEFDVVTGNHGRDIATPAV